MVASLRMLRKDDTGVISGVRASGEMGRRLRSMGIVPGTAFQVQGRAPLYDPVALKIGGMVLTLRDSEADYIDVEVK